LKVHYWHFLQKTRENNEKTEWIAGALEDEKL